MAPRITRRTLFATGAAAAALLIVNRSSADPTGDFTMATITTEDGTNIFSPAG